MNHTILRSSLIAPLLVMASLATTNPVHAAQSLDTCTGYIDSIPATISTQGNWCLRKDLTTAITSGEAITINANNVTLDCNDFKLGGLAGGVATTAAGIFAYESLNTTVRHCHVRGFYYGVVTTGNGGGHVIEDNRLDSNTFISLWVSGDGSVVRRNQVNDTGGSPYNPGSAYGIFTYYGVDVLDNTVSGVLPMADSKSNGSAYGIYTYQNPNGSIRGNRVRGLVRLGWGFAAGIFNTDNSRISLRDNDISGDGSSPSYGVHCDTSNGSTRDNIINGFGIGINGCTDDMTNVIK